MNLESRKQDQVELHAQKEIKKTIKFLGSSRRNPGHTLFQYNQVTKELTKAEFFEEALVLDFKKPVSENTKKKYKVKVQEHCLYFQSLNKKNAIKVLKRDFKIDYKASA